MGIDKKIFICLPYYFMSLHLDTIYLELSVIIVSFRFLLDYT